VQGAALDLTFHLAPWDQPIFKGNTAAISSMSLRKAADADIVYGEFRDWCMDNRVLLVNARLGQDQLSECAFLEAKGFRFIELNYRPVVRGLTGFLNDGKISICPAIASDEPEICGIAATVFDTGRLHADPQVGPEIGNRRYTAWAANAFRNPSQRVMKCLMDGRIVAFMVTEAPTSTRRFWSLVGLAPGLAGRGVGRRVWQAMLAFHQGEGIEEVYTSISSHNTAIHNLYVSLGFRFPAPTITLHWCPFGPIRRPPP
jgi:ribosomal protein S18 acetylase RimI-like enzyme